MHTTTECSVIPNSMVDEAISAGVNSYYLTDVTYVGFSIYTIFLPEILKEFALTVPKYRLVDTVWNYVDAGIIIISSLATLFKDSAQPVVDKSKATSNLIGATQLIILTIIGLDAIAFLIATSIGLMISLFETGDAIRRRFDRGYWQRTTAANLELFKRQVQILPNEIDYIQSVYSEEGVCASFLQGYLLDLKTNRLKTLEKDIQISSYELNNNAPNYAQLNKEIRYNILSDIFWCSTFVGLLLIEIPSLELIGLILIAFAISLYPIQLNHDKLDAFVFGESENLEIYNQYNALKK